MNPWVSVVPDAVFTFVTLAGIIFLLAMVACWAVQDWWRGGQIEREYRQLCNDQNK